MTEYLTVVECLRQNGYRHYCNGYRYLERHMFKHALGSFAKAQKNYDQAELLDGIMGIDYGSQEVVATYMYMEDGRLIVRTIDNTELYNGS